MHSPLKFYITSLGGIMIDYEQFFSSSAKRMKKSEIRELLKLTRQPGIISFAGGLPAPDLFPVEEIKEISQLILDREGTVALQYGPTEGDTVLREELLKLSKKNGVDISLDQLVIITSSQQGLDLVGKVFVDPGDIVMTGNPTYVGGIQAFNSYGAKMVGIDLDDQGMNVELLEAKIKALAADGKKPRFIYVVPDFQNPSGLTMGLERRKQLIDVAERYDLIIIEDSPYRQLRFEGEAEPPLISLNPERVLALYTFSKILLPGFRLGWMAGPKTLIQKMVVAKQAVDLCSPPFNQAILAEYVKRGSLEKQIGKIIAAYRDKRDFMLAKLEEYMPKMDGLKWTRPQGGLFLWVTVPPHIDTTEIFPKAIEKKVAYVVGRAFFPNEGGQHAMRINFSYASKEDIDQGVQRLAELIKEA